MLKLLTCARGHFWESADEPSPERPLACPQCGAPADTLPLLDLGPSEPLESLPPPVPPLERELFDGDGRPNVAGFEILEDLGRSATGVRLYRARQRVINREVLLEVVAARDDPSQRAWGSLRGEAGALGKLSHPNIVQIHDVGERDRQLFYNATELVEGPTLAQKVADRPLSFVQVARVMELLARAVDHAHQQGVLHRNLRPSSVLLQPVVVPQDSPVRDEPLGALCPLHNGFFIPRLTGFGLTRRAVEGEAIDADLFGDDTGFLSPEQAWGRTRDLGPCTDVYGLGGILYFLLTGRAPFRGPSPNDIVDAIQTAELVRPSALRSVPADLETICRKCLARMPRRRYASAGELADDLARVVRHLPLKGQQSVGERLRRLIRRRPALVGLLGVCFLSVLGMFVAHAIGSSGAEQARFMEGLAQSNYRRELNSAAHLQTQLQGAQRFKELVRYRQRLDRAQAIETNPKAARALLEGVRESERAVEWHYLMARLSSPAVKPLEHLATNITAVAFGGQGDRFAATVEPGERLDGGQRRGVVRLWDLTAKNEVRKWSALPGPVHALAFSPDGLRLAVAGGNAGDSNGELRVFSLEEGPAFGNEVMRQTVVNNRFTGLAYTSEGREIVVAGGNAQLYRLGATDGRFVHQFGQAVWVGFNRPSFTRLAVSPNGTIATSTDGADVRVYYPGQTYTNPLPPSGSGEVLAFALTDRLLAVARADRGIRLRRLDVYGSGQEDVEELPRPAARLAISPNGQRLAAVVGSSVYIWGLEGGSAVELLKVDTQTGEAGLAFGHSAPTGQSKTLFVAGPRKIVVLGEPGE